MWGDSRPANRTGPFRGSQEERFAPGWNRDYPPPPLKSPAQERQPGDFPGRDSLPFGFQGRSGPPFAHAEERPFRYGARDGLLGDYPGGEGSGHDFRAGDFSSSDFQSRDSSQLDFRGRDAHSGGFREREGPPLDYRGGGRTCGEYRGREASHMSYRDRDAHTVDFRGRDAPPSDFRGGRGAYDLDFRGREGPHTDFRGRDLSDLDFRTREQSRSDFRNRDVSDLDFRDKDGTQVDFRGRGSGTSDLDFRDRETPRPDFRNRHRSRADQDFRGRDVGACVEPKGRERPSVDPNVLDYIQPSTQDREHSGVNVNKREEATHDHTAERPAFGTQKGELEHSETREGETQGVAFEQESSSDFQNSQSPLQDQDKAQPSGGDRPSSGSGLFKEEGGLDFLGRQDTDYRSMEYRDVDLRLPGGQLFGYGQSKPLPERRPREGPQELQDQDYRTGPSEETASKLIRLNGVPENATEEEILSAFRTPEDRPAKDLQLKGYNTGYDYGYVCVEFSLLEDAIGCMEANQGTLLIRDKEVALEYVPSLDCWYCKWCKAPTAGHRPSCSVCKGPREVTDGKQGLVTYPQLQKTPLPPPSEKQPSPPPRPADREPEPKEREEGPEPRSGHQKKEAERYPPPSRREGLGFRRDREKDPWSGETRQDGESKTIMLKRIYRSTPPEVIVEVLEPYVHLTTANVRIIKNRTGPMGHTYGFIDLDSHAEALRVVKILQNLDPPFSIDGKMVAVNLATGKRRNDSGDHSDHYSQGKRYLRDRRGGGRNSDWSSDSHRQGQQSSSDCYIYDSATGYYYDPLAGTYYDPSTQQEVYVPPDPGSPDAEESQEKQPASQGTAGGKKEASRRDGKERKGRGGPRFQEDASEEPAPLEDVFKKPLPPTVRKEESPPPPKVVNPLIGLLGEYGGDSDYEEEEEEEEEQPPPPQPRAAPPPQQEELSKKENEEDKLTDWNKLACLLCRRQFPNKDVLVKHQQLSDLHKQNLEIHRKIKQSEQELAYLERREREGKFKERGNDRREKLQSFDSPERKRMKYSRETDSDRRPADRDDADSGSKGGCGQQAAGWRKGPGYGHPGVASAEEVKCFVSLGCMNLECLTPSLCGPASDLGSRGWRGTCVRSLGLVTGYDRPACPWQCAGGGNGREMLEEGSSCSYRVGDEACGNWGARG